jgi:hypothetical protein
MVQAAERPHQSVKKDWRADYSGAYAAFSANAQLPKVALPTIRRQLTVSSGAYWLADAAPVLQI